MRATEFIIESVLTESQIISLFELEELDRNTISKLFRTMDHYFCKAALDKDTEAITIVDKLKKIFAAHDLDMVYGDLSVDRCMT